MSEDGWIEIKRVLGPDGRCAVKFIRNSDGLIKFTHEIWQKYYEPSKEDLTAPVVGGIWGGKASGLYKSLNDAEHDAARIVPWYVAIISS